MTGSVKEAIIARRGKEARNIAKVAASRRLLTLVYYGMRDGHIRCLATTPEDAPPPVRCGMNSKQLSWPAARREVARFSAPPPPAARALS